MNALTAAQILHLWENGHDLAPIDRALAILAVGFPEETWEALADQSIGSRDEGLLRLRLATFGPRLASQAYCPGCNELSEFDVEIPALLERGSPGIEESQGFDWVAPSGAALRCRLPNSRDLAAAAGFPNAEKARRLVELCLVQGEAGLLTPEDLDCLGLQMAERDPLADIRFELDCPACGKHWQAPFDILAFFWEEINAEARRLAGQVDLLARAYGWREGDILAMSARRRQMYVDLAG
jgi:hypothetical protein